MVRFGTDKDIQKLIRRAKKQGWVIRCDGSQHIRVEPPSGQSFSVPMTPGSKERVRRAMYQFRRAGLK